MRNKPTRNQQAHSKQNRQNRQPVLPRPPKRKQETHAQNNTRDLARDDVKPAEYKQGAYQRRPEVASRQGDSADSALHCGDAAFVGVQ